MTGQAEGDAMRVGRSGPGPDPTPTAGRVGKPPLQSDPEPWAGQSETENRESEIGRAFHVMTKPIGPICNLDCKYCFYLEKEALYEEERRERPSWQMPDDVLERYIREYIESQDVPEISFAWQGGEPTLLGVRFFRRVVELQRKYANGKRIANALQTNGTLLDDEWGVFLAENDFLIGLSLDGPAEEHDKCRVFKNGGGTFKVAYSNLLKLRNFNETYFKEFVTILGVYTDKHDYNKCVDFTRTIGALGYDHSPAEYVGTFVTNPESTLAAYSNSLEKRLADFKKKASSQSLNQDVKMQDFANLFPFAKLNYDHPAGTNSLQLQLTCPMGFDNLMLSAKGEFLICHKVDDGMPIGDCRTGLDFERLVDLNYQYNSAINNDECKNCWIVNFCRVCAATRMAGDRFLNPAKKECDYFRLRVAYDFSCFVHLSLEHPILLEKIFAYRNDKKSFIGVIDINEF